VTDTPNELSGERLAGVMAARDDALRIVRAIGRWEGSGPTKVLFADIANLKIVHGTPFSDRWRAERATRTYQQALGRQRAKPDRPYSIEVWFARTRIFAAEWSVDGEMQVNSFSPGRWQEELARLAPKGPA
jgi:hypothetical protein